MRVTVIVPVFNEKDLIHALLDRVSRTQTPGYDKEIIVVDDGSTDGTADALRACVDRFGIRLLIHDRNRGKAAAIRTALGEARGDILLIQDGDLEYSPEDYPALLVPFSDPGVAAVYGSRFLVSRWPQGMKAHNWLANRLFTITLNLLYGSRMTDEGTAYKVFRKTALTADMITRQGFEFCPEVTTRLLKRGSRIVEVPVSYVARNRMEGKKPRLVDGLRILLTLLRQRFMD